MVVIREVSIIFTQERTTIGTGLQNVESGLKITVIPNANGTTIKSIGIYYAGQDYGQLTNAKVFSSLTLSLQSKGETLIERISNYLNQLSSEEFDIIVQQYSLYIEDGIIIDGIICGIAAYFSILWLNENHLTALCSFSFLAPTYIDSGNSVNKQMFRTLVVPLATLIRSTNRVMTQLASFVTTFINIWEPLFIDGPIIPEANDIRVAMDIIGQLTQQITLTMDQQMSIVKEQLTKEITEQLTKEITAQVLTVVEYRIIDLIKTNCNTAVVNNISKYYSDSSEIIYERSQNELSTKSEKNNLTNTITRRNNNYTTRTTKIQSTGRFSSPLPWRK